MPAARKAAAVVKGPDCEWRATYIGRDPRLLLGKPKWLDVTGAGDPSLQV